MTPGIVGDKRELHLLHSELAGLVKGKCLGIGGKGCDALCLVGAEFFLARFGNESTEVALLESELGALVDEHALDVELVVGPLGAVYDRTTLYAYHSAVGFYLPAGAYSAGFHVEVDGHFITLLPLAGDGEVSVLCYGTFSFCAIDLDAVAETLVVAVAVELTWKRTALEPTGDTDLEVKLSAAIAVNLDVDVTTIGVAGGLCEGYLLAGNAEA